MKYEAYEKTLPPRPKAAFKIPMSQAIVAIDGTFWRYDFRNGKIRWYYVGSAFIQ
jgi:hypothetical protein